MTSPGRSGNRSFPSWGRAARPPRFLAGMASSSAPADGGTGRQECLSNLRLVESRLRLSRSLAAKTFRRSCLDLKTFARTVLTYRCISLMLPDSVSTLIDPVPVPILPVAYAPPPSDFTLMGRLHSI